jgi:adenosylmethionine-8-amino-7-oxononanoate aminotransferase
MSKLSESDKKNIWHPFTPLAGGPDPVLIESASGVYLHTSGGRKIIDAVSSWWVNLHGHSNPHIAQAIADQAHTLEHVIFAGFTHEPAIQLAENLLSILPENQARIFFSDNGSTAVEVALKMAFQFWYNQGRPKNKVVAIRGAYHGDTFGSMSVGDRGIFTDPFKNHLFETHFIDFPEAGKEDAVVAEFKKIVRQPGTGAFIYEPLVQAAAGMRMYAVELLETLLQEARAHNVICIADEVFTGFGRTGKLFASGYCHTKPDIIAVSKGITGGALPLGVTSCSDEVLEAYRSDDFLKTFFHGHSYTANPLACAAANASFALLMKEECAAAIQRIASAHEQFRRKIRSHPTVLEARTLGTILAIELKTEEGSSYGNVMRKKIYEFFIHRDILLRPLGNVLYVLPPYVITDDQLQTVYISIEEFLNELLK